MDPAIVPFDLQRMFIGDYSLWFLAEIVFRTSFMYVYAILAAKIIGQRGMGQLTPFEYIIVIALGSATGDPMFYPNVPLLHGLTVITVIVIFERLIAKLTVMNLSIERALESVPTLLVENGDILEHKLTSSTVSREELHMQLRIQGVRNVSEVERAYLEPSGKISVFRYQKGGAETSESTLPEENPKIKSPK